MNYVRQCMAVEDYENVMLYSSNNICLVVLVG